MNSMSALPTHVCWNAQKTCLPAAHRGGHGPSSRILEQGTMTIAHAKMFDHGTSMLNRRPTAVQPLSNSLRGLAASGKGPGACPVQAGDRVCVKSRRPPKRVCVFLV